MQYVTAVDPLWLAELGPMFFSVKESYKTRLVRAFTCAITSLFIVFRVLVSAVRKCARDSVRSKSRWRRRWKLRSQSWNNAHAKWKQAPLHGKQHIIYSILDLWIGLFVSSMALLDTYCMCMCVCSTDRTVVKQGKIGSTAMTPRRTPHRLGL